MKKIFIILILLLTFVFPIYAKAQNNCNYKFIDISNDSYIVKNIEIFNKEENNNAVFFIGKTLEEYGLSIDANKEGMNVPNLCVWENPTYVIKEGLQNITILLHSPYDKYVVATIEIEGIKSNSENINELVIENVTEQEQNIMASLTAKFIILDTSTNYDINVNNRPETATYSWISSDTNIASVEKNGVVTGKSKGKAEITCNVKTETALYNLTSNVVVGEDDNAPVLSDTELDLEVGDLYQLKVENQISKSTYKWSSSDKKTAKVTSSNGKVTGISVGTADIYCTITSPDKKVIVLKCTTYVE